MTSTMCDTSNLRTSLNKLTLCDISTDLDESNTDAGDVNSDLAWIHGCEEGIYEEGRLPLVECLDGCGKALRLRDANGLLMSPNVAPDVLHRIDTVSARPDDVLIATYPKCGTHWTWEIVSMLSQGSESLVADTLHHVDFLPLNMLEALPSPRVLATHMPFSRLPRSFALEGCKVIWVVRNPWDVAVSYYHFIRKMNVFGYAGEWNGFFDLFLDGNVPYNSWFEHTSEWLKGKATTSNILMVRYEDLHSSFKKEVGRIADHLNIPVTEQRLEAMQTQTAFANMAARKPDIAMPLSVDGSSPVYRKGQCGDWRNWFTEQQSAELKGAYRVAIGSYNRILQYSNGKTVNGMTQMSV